MPAWGAHVQYRARVAAAAALTTFALRLRLLTVERLCGGLDRRRPIRIIGGSMIERTSQAGNVALSQPSNPWLRRTRHVRIVDLSLLRGLIKHQPQQ